MWGGTFGDAQTNSANEDTMNERKKTADPHGNLRRVMDAYGVNAPPCVSVRQMWDAAMDTVTSVELGEALGAAEALVAILRERVAKDRDVCVRCMGEGVVGVGEKCPSTIHAAS